MLSILIPVYNFDIRTLVSKLHQQAEKLQLVFEILVVDDASNTAQRLPNEVFCASLSHARYVGLQQNIGRASIRNHLTQLAQYEYLLFMDCDSMPISSYFLANYIDKVHPNKLLYGGRVYCKEKPTDIDLILHWSYGVQREVVNATKRNQQPYQSFMTNNFLIPKSIALQYPFDASIKQYGHEDTLFGIELKNGGVIIQHIDNPLEHIDIETTRAFLNKTEKALENLAVLQEKYALRGHIKLLDFYYTSKCWKLIGLIMLIGSILNPLIKKNLYSKRPNLRLFDFYRLYVLVQKIN